MSKTRKWVFGWTEEKLTKKKKKFSLKDWTIAIQNSSSPSNWARGNWWIWS